MASQRAVIQPETRLAMARTIAAGMAYLHERSPAIVHGDLKSLNLLVDSELRIKRERTASNRVQEVAWGLEQLRRGNHPPFLNLDGQLYPACRSPSR
eukprot:332292-Chlamydomonas_euryale.AAC.1